jgi:hypothetical protein
MSPNVAVGAENLVFAVLFVAMGLLLVTGRVPMNRRFGFRFREAYDSHETWRKVNRYGGYRLIGWSAAMLGAGVLALFRPYEDNALLITFLSFAPLLAIVRVVSESRRYTRSLSDPQPERMEKAED